MRSEKDELASLENGNGVSGTGMSLLRTLDVDEGSSLVITSFPSSNQPNRATACAGPGYIYTRSESSPKQALQLVISSVEIHPNQCPNYFQDVESLLYIRTLEELHEQFEGLVPGTASVQLMAKQTD